MLFFLFLFQISFLDSIFCTMQAIVYPLYKNPLATFLANIEAMASQLGVVTQIETLKRCMSAMNVSEIIRDLSFHDTHLFYLSRFLAPILLMALWSRHHLFLGFAGPPVMSRSS